jgi:penicillin amidase
VLDDTPHALNPPQGFLASCNNQVVPASWPYKIPGFYDPYRITRATKFLGGLKPAAPQDMRTMQVDLVSGLALRWKSLAAAGATGADAKMLAEWDGRMSADSRAAALFAAWWRRLPRAVFEDELAADWDQGRVLLEEALTTNVAIDDRRTAQRESLVDVSARAMREAREIANGRTWGEACKLVVRHPLARVKVLDWWLKLNRGPIGGTGDPGSLNANFYSYHDDTKSFRTRVGPSMRFVLDWSNPDAFTLTGALGQSGNPFSPHYDDFFEMTQRGESWNVPFAKESVYAQRRSLLRFGVR